MLWVCIKKHKTAILFFSPLMTPTCHLCQQPITQRIMHETIAPCGARFCEDRVHVTCLEQYLRLHPTLICDCGHRVRREGQDLKLIVSPAVPVEQWLTGMWVALCFLWMLCVSCFFLWLGTHRPSDNSEADNSILSKSLYGPLSDCLLVLSLLFTVVIGTASLAMYVFTYQ
jgi:hypothetical protein